MGLKRFSLKKKTVVAAAITLAAVSMTAAVPAQAAEPDVTWRIVDQGIDDSNKFVYDGNKRDSTMTSLVVKKGSDNKYGYVDRGEVRSTGSIVVGNWDGWWHVVNGWVDTSTGIAETDNGRIKFVNGRMEVSCNKTLENSQWGWLYMVDGVQDTSYTGLASNANGIFWVTKGKWDTSKTDIVRDDNGVAGEVGAWYYIKNGQLSNEDTIASNANGTWMIRGGKVDFGFNGVEKGPKDTDPWYYFTGGAVNWSYNGSASNTHGTWKITNGKVDFGFTGNCDGMYFRGGAAVDSVE